MKENEVRIVQMTETDLGWEFEVNLDAQDHIVSVSHDYYFKLTAGEISPQHLIELSFDFLLSREPSTSILPEFDLNVIPTYFPEYETQILQGST